MNNKLPIPLPGDPNAGSPDYFLYGGAALVAVGVFLLFLLVRYLWDLRTRRMQARMQMVRTGEEQVVLRRRLPQGRIAQLNFSFENLLQQTGLDLTPDKALAWLILIGCVLGSAAYLLSGELGLGAAGLAAGSGGVFATFLIYRSIYRGRLLDQLPDGLGLLARALRSGLSLEQGISLLGHESAAPLANEFKKCDAQVQLGLSVHSCLETMAQRLQSIDLHALVSAVSVFQTSGGNLPILLDRLATSARDRANFRAYFRAAIALSRISIIPVALMVPVMLIIFFFWPPSFVQSFMNTSTAPLVIGGVLLAEGIGLYWIYRLLRFDY